MTRRPFAQRDLRLALFFSFTCVFRPGFATAMDVTYCSPDFDAAVLPLHGADEVPVNTSSIVLEAKRCLSAASAILSSEGVEDVELTVSNGSDLLVVDLPELSEETTYEVDFQLNGGEVLLHHRKVIFTTSSAVDDTAPTLPDTIDYTTFVREDAELCGTCRRWGIEFHYPQDDDIALWSAKVDREDAEGGRFSDRSVVFADADAQPPAPIRTSTGRAEPIFVELTVRDVAGNENTRWLDVRPPDEFVESDTECLPKLGIGGCAMCSSSDSTANLALLAVLGFVSRFRRHRRKS